MGDLQHENEKSKNYRHWTAQESNELLQLLVEAAKSGWRDKNGSFSKQTIEKSILPVLNRKVASQITYTQYQSRMRWFQAQYGKFCKLMRFSSGFGWDPNTKKFTASNEVWEEYFKSHPNDRNLQTDTFADYEDLRVAVGNGTAIGKTSIGLGGDDTDARVYGLEENRRVGIDDLNFDYDSQTFIPPEDETSYEGLLNGQYDSGHPFHATNSEVPTGSTTTRKKKRNRVEHEGNTSSLDTSTQMNVLEKLSIGIDSIATDFRGFFNLMEKRERASTCWDAIKEIPHLDSHVRYKVVELLDTKAKKDMFVKMSLEERSDWIVFKLHQASNDK